MLSNVIVKYVNFVDFIIQESKIDSSNDLNSIVINMDEEIFYTYKAIKGPNYFWMILNEGSKLSYLIFFNSIKKKPLSKSDFVEEVARKCPKDFQWMLFHPEIFNGEYFKDSEEITPKSGEK